MDSNISFIFIKYHSSDEDSLITPYYSKTKIDASSFDATTLHYIGEYQHKFRAYNEELAIQYNDILKLFRNFLPNKGFYACKAFIEYCEKAKGEHQYCSVLIRHLQKRQNYNNLIHDITDNVTDIERLYRSAQLILNYSGIKASVRLGVLSAILGIISLLLGAYSAFLTFLT